MSHVCFDRVIPNSIFYFYIIAGNHLSTAFLTQKKKALENSRIT